MKKVLLVCVLGANLYSCSLLQRHGSSGEQEAEVRDVEPAAEGPLFDSNGKEIGSASTPSGTDSEVSRLNTKIAALETKLDVLSASMERMQAQKSQPVIEAEARPQANLAAPVDESQEVREATQPTQISAAPAKPAHLSEPIVSPEADAVSSGAEKEFRAGMQLFQNGQNLEAASRFALMAKKFPNHLLAAHALYWGGEASARGQQWALAVENWTDLEKRYPRSAYVPEALAGLAKAYDSQGDSTKGKFYRTLLLRSFPKSPVALHVEPQVQERGHASTPGVHRSSPAASPDLAEDETPVFEGGGENDRPSETQ